MREFRGNITYNNSTSKRVLNLLEPINLNVWKVVYSRK